MKSFLSKSTLSKKKRWMTLLAFALISSGMDKHSLVVYGQGLTHKVSFDQQGPQRIPLKMLYNLENVIECFPDLSLETMEENSTLPSKGEEIVLFQEEVLIPSIEEELIVEDSFKVNALDSITPSLSPETFQDPAPLPEVIPEPEDPVWHLSYIPWFNALEAPENGEIGLWADGWFIAHRHTPNGAKIATLVEQIEVDGQLYVLDDAWISTDLITQDEVARIRAKGGITLQTCIDQTTNQMVHYAPLGAGYPYTFVQFPYTIHDTPAIGYWPDDAPSIQTPTDSEPTYSQPVNVEPTFVISQPENPEEPTFKPSESDFELFEEETFQLVEEMELVERHYDFSF